MFNEFRLAAGTPVYLQVKNYIVWLITQGALQEGERLPSTRELAGLLDVSRGSVVAAYESLQDEGVIHAVTGKGNFVTGISVAKGADLEPWHMNWLDRMNHQARIAVELDHMKRKQPIPGGGQATISFTSIAPDEQLFDLDHVKRAFLDRMAVEGRVLLNYGYAKGYKPLIDYLMKYMERKGVDLTGKEMLITSGFTEGLDIVLSSLGGTEEAKPARGLVQNGPGGSGSLGPRFTGRVLCENPTHHTAIKNLRRHGFAITGIPMQPDGLDLTALERALQEQTYDCAYLVPSYHNPTGIVTSAEKRLALLQLLGRYRVPVIEDGFNEELRYSGAHVAPLIAMSGQGNGVVYLGSFSKVLFPGIRIGWVLADRELIEVLESVKRARSIHTSTLDQSVLYQYLHNGHLEKYMKKARTEYKRKYELARACCEEFVPYARLSGSGGLHLFLEFREGFDTWELLQACAAQGVIFTPGDMFFTDGGGRHTLRLGISRVKDEDITQGIRLIGETAARLLALKPSGGRSAD
ncbi:PLP-dependent aminotransferase family protein [Paenibacillus sanguinis]|uniref:aminotransferase-like domain-containing protein n=1 Tax=Paenibacillus sanguinis TaxID=225906 RepID=UPI00037437F6|nr:PLP-dependent aminotransferase family protein [Paenibacillus sanguinis]